MAKQCQLCEDTTATLFCKQCNESFCSEVREVCFFYADLVAEAKWGGGGEMAHGRAVMGRHLRADLGGTWSLRKDHACRVSARLRHMVWRWGVWAYFLW